ncbi:unnamed protein product [Didymodactylos carnosus]|uniref:Uncharacterized protein n=2 Tax=Didymodactylos carnosus TaxID=1234261 RepID=A0A8S2D9A2_9BILA|nr:unnamed protein product [Didymodactylos carnosus]CAF3626624.1 unnamed protein product [Didymodactylos carnosus]
MKRQLHRIKIIQHKHPLTMLGEDDQSEDTTNSSCFTIVHTQKHPLNEKERSAASLSSRTSQAFWKEIEEQRQQSLLSNSNSSSLRRKMSNKLKDKCNLLETAFISGTSNKNTSLVMINESIKTPIVLNLSSIIRERTSSVDSLEEDKIVKDHIENLIPIQGTKSWINDIQQQRVENCNEVKSNINGLSRWRSFEDEFMLPVSINQLTSSEQHNRRKTLSESDIVSKNISSFVVPNINIKDENEEETSRMDIYHTVQLIEHDPIENMYSTSPITNVLHFDAQLQVDNGHLTDAVRYGVFHSSPQESMIQISCQQFKCNHETQTMEIDENEEECHSFNLRQYVLLDTLETSMDISESLASTTSGEEQDYVVRMQIKGTLLDSNHLKLQNIIELNEQYDDEEEHDADNTMDDENFDNANESHNVTLLMDDGERQYVNSEPSSSDKHRSYDTRDEQTTNRNGYQSSGNGFRNSFSGSGGGGSGSGRGNDEDEHKNNNPNDDDEESIDDETIARRLGFHFDNVTLELIHSIRQLVRKRSYDRRDFDYLQTLIDEIIKLQQLYSSDNIDLLLRTMVKLLRLDRPLRTFINAENFLRDRIQYAKQQQRKKRRGAEEDIDSLEERPVRAVKYQITNDEPVRRSTNNSNGSVFDYWKNKDQKSKLHGMQQRARSESSPDQQYRSRHDSKDSLEEMDETSLPPPTFVSPGKRRNTRETDREVAEITQDTSIADPLTSVGRAPTKVKQMARDIEYRTVPVATGTNRSEMNMRTGDRFRDHVTYLSDDSAQIPSAHISVALYDIKPNLKNQYSNEERTRPAHSDGILEESEHRTTRAKQQRIYDSPISSPSLTESRVKRIVDRLEHDQQLSPNTTTIVTKSSIKKTFDEYSIDSYSEADHQPPVKRSKDIGHKKVIKSQIYDAEREEDGGGKVIYRRKIERNIPKDSVDRGDEDHSARTTSSSPRQRVTYHSGDDDTYIRIDSVRDGQELPNDVKEFVISHTKPKRYNRILGIETNRTITEPDISSQEDRQATETSITMVRDVRARMYEDKIEKTTKSTTTPVEEIMKVDLETLYILEQRGEKPPSAPTMMDIYVSPEYRYIIEEEREEHDEHHRTYHPAGINTAVQTIYTQPTSRQKFQRPIGTQSDLNQATITTQTTDSLHRQPKERKKIIVDANTQTTIKDKSSLKSDDSSDGDGTVVYIDNREENFECWKKDTNEGSSDETDYGRDKDHPSIGKITSKIKMDQIRDLNRNVVRRHFEESEQQREFYEIHTRGQCKCVVLSIDDYNSQEVIRGDQTAMEEQITKIEKMYTFQALQHINLHVLYTRKSS